MILLLVWRIWSLFNDQVHNKQIPSMHVSKDYLSSYLKRIVLVKHKTMGGVERKDNNRLVSAYFIRGSKGDRSLASAIGGIGALCLLMVLSLRPTWFCEMRIVRSYFHLIDTCFIATML